MIKETKSLLIFLILYNLLISHFLKILFNILVIFFKTDKNGIRANVLKICHDPNIMMIL